MIYLLYGDVAQLGERLPCTEEVTGSSPVVSTILTPDNARQRQKTTDNTEKRQTGHC